MPRRLYAVAPLTELDLSDTPRLISIPEDVKERGAAAVLAFLRDADSEPVQRLKLLGTP